MKRLKVRDVIKLLKADGWYMKKRKGTSHRQFVHPFKTGKVTINKEDGEDLDQFTLNSIWKQAGWK